MEFLNFENLTITSFKEDMAKAFKKQNLGSNFLKPPESPLLEPCFVKFEISLVVRGKGVQQTLPDNGLCQITLTPLVGGRQL